MSARLAAAMILLPLLAAPAVAANPPGPPWPEIVSPGAITLRWYPNDTSEAAAQAAADAHCAATGRAAVFAALEQVGSVQYGTYACR